MNKSADQISFNIEYLPSQSDRTFLEKFEDVHPLSLQGKFSIFVNDNMVAEEIIPILELLTYCQDWIVSNKNRKTKVQNFVFISMEHEDSAIFKFVFENNLNAVYCLYFFEGVRLANVTSVELFKVISALKNDLIYSALSSDLSSMQLRTYLNIDCKRFR